MDLSQNSDEFDVNYKDVIIMRFIMKPEDPLDEMYRQKCELGMFDKATMTKQGICRTMDKGYGIKEGLYINDKLNGFGR